MGNKTSRRSSGSSGLGFFNVLGLKAAGVETDAQRHARLQRQKDREWQQKMEELKNTHQQQQAQIEAELKREMAAHEARLREMEKIEKQQDKASKIKQRDSAVAECKRVINECDTKLTQMKANLQNLVTELHEHKRDITIEDEKIKNFESRKKAKLDKIGLEKALETLEQTEKEIKAAIKLTSVHESSIGQFLTLTQDLLSATLSNQQQANQLSGEMNTFGRLIDTVASGDLSIEYYFGRKGMERLVPILAKEELTQMDDLVCVDEDDVKDTEQFEEIMELVKTGLKKQYNDWEAEEKEQKSEKVADSRRSPKPDSKLSIKQKNFLKNVCYKPKTWQKEQQDKQQVAKEALLEISPLMSGFFGDMHVSMKQAQLILAYDDHQGQLTQEQQKAIESVAKIDLTSNFKAVGAPEPSDASDPARALKNAQNAEDCKKSDEQQEFDANIAEAGELALVQTFDKGGKQVFKQSLALSKAAISSIDVIQRMENQFEGSANKQRALGLARGVEGTCMEIVRSVGKIRRSLLLAHCILKMKPSDFKSEESKNLWNAVDGGLVNLFANALKMSEISVKYFGFFLRFKQSFNYYLAASSKSLLVSTEHLLSDIQEFHELSGTFNKEVARLGDCAMECIENCVRNTAGAENFEKHKADRDAAQAQYLKLQEAYDMKSAELEVEYDEMLEKSADLKAKVATKSLVIQSVEDQIEHDKQLRNATEKTMNGLLQMVI